MDNTLMTWAEPPGPPGTRTRQAVIDQQVEQLRQHPGQWALVERSDRPNRLQNAAQPYRSRGCQASVQRGALYVRWPV